LLKKKPVLISAVTVAALVVIFVGMHFVSAGITPDNGSMGIPIKADYSLVPIYTMQGNQAYMNATATPLLFLDRSDESGRYAQAVQGLLQKMRPAKPLVMVSTDFSSSDLKSAEAVTAAFEKEYNLTLPVVLQAGDARAYAPKVPMLVYYTIENGHPVPHQVTTVPTEDEIKAAVGQAVHYPGSQKPRITLKQGPARAKRGGLCFGG
jgi:hypothetical protein